MADISPPKSSKLHVKQTLIKQSWCSCKGTLITAVVVLFVSFQSLLSFQNLLQTILAETIKSKLSSAFFSTANNNSIAKVTQKEAIHSLHTNVNIHDADCLFRESPLYRSVYVYPSPLDADRFAAMKSPMAGMSNTNGTVDWPWIPLNQELRTNVRMHYDPTQVGLNHFSLELYIHDIFTHPKSCLQTTDPEHAKLFYVPHLQSIHSHYKGGKFLKRYGPWSPWASAIRDATANRNYTLWEDWFGLTSRYWKRNNGTDHLLVMPEPCGGLKVLYPKMICGNPNFLTVQQQNTAPIIVSVELTTSYVNHFPNCAQKNIVMPYPNVDGRWFFGDFDQQAINIRTANHWSSDYRPQFLYYSAGIHGPCARLRLQLDHDYRCSKNAVENQNIDVVLVNQTLHRAVQMRLSQFCLCPVGDSASARRMYDAVQAGCIPVILSPEFVWAMSTDVDPTSHIHPTDFAIRLDIANHTDEIYNKDCLRRVNTTSLTVEEYLRTISDDKVKRLQQGLKAVAPLYSFYRVGTHRGTNSGDTLPPLSDYIMPNGGAVERFIHELAIRTERSHEVLWPSCEEETKVHNSSFFKFSKAYKYHMCPMSN